MKKLDFNTLTLGEAAFVETYGGVPVAKLEDEDTPTMKATIALVTIVKRRNGFPRYSTVEAEQLALSDLEDILGDDEDDEGEDEAQGE
ncbi:MAG: hypothetical protein JWP75_3886 [Frondihabitans sp.]|nr:hypothetical protein [Frondihabitans sp.]